MLRAAIIIASLGLLSACATTGGTTETASAPSAAATPAPAPAAPAAPAAPPAPAAPAASATPAVALSPADAEGKRIMEVSCTSCHGVETVIDERRTSAGWDTMIHSMVEKGAIISDAEIPVLKAYLLKNYGA